MSRLLPLKRWTKSKPRLGFCITSSDMREKSSKASEAVEYAPTAWSSRKKSVPWARRPPAEAASMARQDERAPATQTSKAMRPRKMTMPLRENVSRTSQSPGMTTLTGRR